LESRCRTVLHVHGAAASALPGRTPHAVAAFHSSSVSAAVKPVVLSDIGEGIAEVELKEWFVKVGDTVRSFDQLVKVESDKVRVAVAAPFTARPASHDGGGVPRCVAGECGDFIEVRRSSHAAVLQARRHGADGQRAVEHGGDGRRRRHVSASAGIGTGCSCSGGALVVTRSAGRVVLLWQRKGAGDAGRAARVQGAQRRPVQGASRDCNVLFCSVPCVLLV
jgi:hypothetical protein